MKKEEMPEYTEEDGELADKLRKMPRDMFEALERLVGVFHKPELLEAIFEPGTQEDRLYELAVFWTLMKLHELHIVTTIRIAKQFGFQKEKYDAATKKVMKEMAQKDKDFWEKAL